MITIDEAIEVLRLTCQGEPYPGKHKIEDALRLGIEALKRVRDYKEAHILGLHYTPMPGETED